MKPGLAVDVAVKNYDRSKCSDVIHLTGIYEVFPHLGFWKLKWGQEH